MYLWNIKKLKEELIARPLPEVESLKYLIANTILYFASILFFALIETNIWDIYSIASHFIILSVAIIYFYRCNGGKSGNNFLQNFFSLSWVVSIRLTIMVFIPFLILVYVLFGLTEQTSEFDFVYFVLFDIIYVYLLGRHFEDVALVNEEKR